ncbi:MAG: hypothetical protein A2452_04030 [Candidatus Firestonebacteria bacterium RIFOXYC2_FULL_39_67]|nr:MAG: hypothetical protein A2536_09115 [Candidatus Firestonebacteria bacterium RIFOXYD2_FULL_39_29]OGF56130.1 MAG: hypothetical protein A2452_04030 [Candidatus Firestonebacteria bacterium RIFOXYC2_FULL_39_67]OGF57980.1 MAG: hypothetical protein A2497_02150 [Candidatus Firestonebacteria bacterium RifOxyC12_full_39_7]
MKTTVKLAILAVLVGIFAIFVLKIESPAGKNKSRESFTDIEVTPEGHNAQIEAPKQDIPIENYQDKYTFPGPEKNKGAKWIKILNYHEIFPESVRSSKDPKINRFSKPSDLLLIVSLENFEEQMKYLSENYKCVKMSDFGLRLEKKQSYDRDVIVITFDGADESIYKYAYPVLKKYKLPATLFLHINSVKLDRTAMSWETIKIIHEEGLMEIESHSMSHPHLNKMKGGETGEEYEKRIKRELVESKNIIEEKLKKNVYYFAYPYGGYNSTVMRLLKESGYKAAVTVQWDKNTMESNPFALKRRGVFGNINLKQFSELLSNNYKDDMREYAD